MKGMWRNFWVRMCVTVFFASLTNILCSGSPLVHQVWVGTFIAPYGVLDFAGGSVIHVTPWAAILPFWIAAEVKAFRTGTPLPLGCYLIFTVILISGVNWMPILVNGFASWGGVGLLLIVEVGVSALLAAVPANIYYRLWRRRAARLSVPEIF